MSLRGGIVQSLPHLGIRREGFALLDTDRLQRIDHRAVALQPGLGLDDAVQRLVEMYIVGNGRVVENAGRIDVGR